MSKRKTTSFYEGAAFLELKEEWDRKLKEAGFEDVEEQDAEDEFRRMKSRLRNNPGHCEALAHYFTEAERGLATLVFDCPDDRAIWIHHARGASVREIAELVHLSRQVVERRIGKYQKRLGIRRPR